MNETSEITARFFTECKNCIFLTNGNCQLNRLEKFKNKNLVIYDENSEFPRIKTFCNTFRKELPNTQNPIQTVLDEIRVQIDFIVINYEKCLNLNIRNIIYEINKQTIPPANVIIVSKSTNTQYNEIYELLNVKLLPKFRLIRVYETDSDYNRCLDIAVNKSNSTYYTIFKEYIPYDFIEKIDKKINHDLEPFSMIDSASLEGFTVQTQLHKILEGCKNGWIGDKIRELAKDQLLDKMVLKYEEFA